MKMHLKTTPLMLFVSLLLLEVAIAQDHSADQQLKGFSSAIGAKANLYAAEPLVKNPVHMNWDAKGRLWVVNTSLSPESNEGQIVILEDTTQDGKSDTSTLFADKLNAPTSVLPGPDSNSAYVTSSTEILFLRDTDDDGYADQRKLVLSGFDSKWPKDRAHSLRYGPLGNIWFTTNGVAYFNPESTPTTKTYFTQSYNSWGHTFTQFGQSYLTLLESNEGLHYVFPEADYRRNPKQAPNSTLTKLSGQNQGAPFYAGLESLSGFHIPDNLRGTLATCAYTKQQVHLFKLTEEGSAKHSILISNSDKNFQPVDIKMGPDGAIYVADWYSPTAINTVGNPSNQLGRIWRLTFSERPLQESVDFSNLNDSALLQLVNSTGYRGPTAIRELSSRDPETTIRVIQEAWEATDDELTRLHLLMTAQSIGRFQEKWAIDLIENASQAKVRSGAIRCYYFSKKASRKTVLANSVSDSNSEVSLWAVCNLAKQKSPDTATIALPALKNISDKPNQYLDFTLKKIGSTHEDNPAFTNQQQPDIDLEAINQNIQIPPPHRSKKQLREIAIDQQTPIEQRTEAIKELAQIDITEGTELAAIIIPTLENENHSQLIFNLFLDENRSSENLANALQPIELPQHITKTGIRCANASNLQAIQLLAVLNAKLKPTESDQ